MYLKHAAARGADEVPKAGVGRMLPQYTVIFTGLNQTYVYKRASHLAAVTTDILYIVLIRVRALVNTCG